MEKHEKVMTAKNLGNRLGRLGVRCPHLIALALAKNLQAEFQKSESLHMSKVTLNRWCMRVIPWNKGEFVNFLIIVDALGLWVCGAGGDFNTESKPWFLKAGKRLPQLVVEAPKKTPSTNRSTAIQPEDEDF